MNHSRVPRAVKYSASRIVLNDVTGLIEGG